MGLFSGMKKNFRKSEAAAIIQGLLEKQTELGLFPANEVAPSEMATKLIQVVWDNNPGISESKTVPNKLALASVGLSSGILAMDKSGRRDILLALKFCLGQILLEINAAGQRMELHALDVDLIDQAQGVYAHFSED